MTIYTGNMEYEAKKLIGRYTKDRLGYSQEVDKMANIKAIIIIALTIITSYVIGGIISIIIMIAARIFMYSELRSYSQRIRKRFEYVDKIISLIPEKCIFIKF